MLYEEATLSSGDWVVLRSDDEGTFSGRLTFSLWLRLWDMVRSAEKDGFEIGAIAMSFEHVDELRKDTLGRPPLEPPLELGLSSKFLGHLIRIVPGLPEPILLPVDAEWR